MIARDVCADVLLGLAVLTVASASLGVLLMRNAYDKLHFVTPAALVAPVLVALAVLVQMGLYENTGEICLALLAMVIDGPYLAHATMRATRIREQGDWRQ
ncbi:MAG: monovalent cation/H(+) antiporter subunit G [Streptosporangiaceae bacterium]